MNKSTIKEYLRNRGIIKFKLKEVRNLDNCSKELKNIDPREVGKLYKVNNEYWLCLSASRYNVNLQRVEVLDG